ncbi:MAG: hypothetical protein U0271_14400 [Polyangiaceae bacterium]
MARTNDEAPDGDERSAEFKTAPPAPIYVVLTGVLLAIPVIWAVMAVREPPARDTAVLVILAFTVVAGATWLLLRPSRYRVSAAGIDVVWPLRELTIKPADIVAVRAIRGETLAHELRGARVGIAGLFGSFGWIRTRSGWATALMTANDAAVVIERRGQRPLVVTPAEPENFARAIGSIDEARASEPAREARPDKTPKRANSKVKVKL